MKPYRTYRIVLESEDDHIYAEQRIAVDLAVDQNHVLSYLEPDIKRAVMMLVHQLTMKEERCRAIPELPSSGSGS